MREQLVAGVEVRRNNGQCDYGPWIAGDDADVPTWVGDQIADEIAEVAMTAAVERERGSVQRGGSIWSWRKAGPKKPKLVARCVEPGCHCEHRSGIVCRDQNEADFYASRGYGVTEE